MLRNVGCRHNLILDMTKHSDKKSPKGNYMSFTWNLLILLKEER